jgi:membrane protein CcdC involved in cytochrome C biogenesis
MAWQVTVLRNTCGFGDVAKSPHRLTDRVTHSTLLLQLRPLFTAGASLAGAAAMLLWRLRETTTPVTVRKIVAPPLGMATGLAMFLVPAARIPWSWAIAAFLVGAVVLAIPVARTSRLVRSGDVVLMQRSKAFLWILLGLVAVRFAARAYVEHLVSPIQSGALFFLLAFGMILRWRVGMVLAYRRLCSGGEAGGGDRKWGARDSNPKPTA